MPSAKPDGKNTYVLTKIETKGVWNPAVYTVSSWDT